MRKQLTKFLGGFISLFYPHLCLACNHNTPPFKELICTECQFKLPKTGFHLERENDFTQRFLGRFPLNAGAAMFWYSKGGRAQRLVYNLKYYGKKQVGLMLGEMYGRQLGISPFFQKIDLIVPVPLHWKKERTRGYNQSDFFAEGLSETMKIPWLKDGLKRTAYSESQTKKSRTDRIENVMKVFEVKRQSDLEGKHILLVDDVLTTGATLEACATKILDLPNTKVSLVTIAIAEN